MKDEASGGTSKILKAFPVNEVARMMRMERGKHFDPDLLDVFLDSLPEVLRVTAAEPGSMLSSKAG